MSGWRLKAYPPGNSLGGRQFHLVSMQGISILSVMLRICSELVSDRGPNIPTTPFSENISSPFAGKYILLNLTEKVASFSLRHITVILWNMHHIGCELHVRKKVPRTVKCLRNCCFSFTWRKCFSNEKVKSVREVDGLIILRLGFIFDGAVDKCSQVVM